MSKWPGFRRKALVLTGVMSSAACLPGLVQAQDNAESEVEEVIVTGSYIRGSPLDAPSPVQVVDRASIEAQGAAQIWDVIKNLEVNSGSISNEGSDGGIAEMGATSGMANINLRNLGENSTLTLINGKRMAPAATVTPTGGEFVDINTIPLVMVERLEVLTDGGSALYGADAVAGVVNVIMRTQFEGLELYGDIQAIEKDMGNQDRTLSAIWGWANDSGSTHFVLSGEMFRRDPVPISAARYFDERSEFTGTVGGFGTPLANAAFGSNVNSAYLNQEVMAQAVAEGGNADPRYTDPLCFELSSADGAPYFTGTRTADRGEPSASCREDTYQWSLLNVGMERDSVAGAFNHAFNDTVEFYSFAQYSSSDIERSDAGAYSARGPTMFLAQPGAHVGNPAWGGYSIGQPMELGYFAPSIGLARPTAADITNAPTDIRNGGINVPSYGAPNIGSSPRMGGGNQVSRTEAVSVQTGLKGEFIAFNNRRFNYDVSYSWSGTSFELEYKTFQRDRAHLAANGLGGPNCTPNGVPDFDFLSARGHISPAIPTGWDFVGASMTQLFFPGFVFNTRESLSLALTSNNQGQGGCEFYNPFLTRQSDPNLANSQELVDWMLPTIRRSDKRNKLGVFDAVLSGEMFEMAGGVAQFAVGAQYREQSTASIAPAMNQPGLNAIAGYGADGTPNEFQYVSNNFECSECIFNYDHTRTTNAAFMEVSLPFLNGVESQVALRYEDYGGRIGSEVTPKVALSWRPTDSLLVRGSFSQSFRAPNIGVQLEGLEAGQVTFRDPISAQAVRAGMAAPTNANAEPETTYTVGTPAPDIGNEYANTYSAGFIWTPQGRLQGFSFNADFWRFEVKDRVMPQPAISAIGGEISAFEVAAANPDNYVVNGTIASSPSAAYAGLDPYQSCDPAALSAQWGDDPEASKTSSGQVIPLSRLDCVVDPRTYVVDGVVRSAGSTTGSLITISSATINAGEVTADGVDLKASYAWDTDMGRFRIASDFTFVNQYKLSDVPGLELGLRETGLFDAAGTTGDGLLVRSLPDKKGNLTLSWTAPSMKHTVTMINRFVGSYDNLAYEDTFENGNDYVRSIVNREIDSYHSIDLQYNYVHEWANRNLGTTLFTVGAHDAFNAELPFHYSGALNYDAYQFDGRGRRLYARVLMQF
ncbi:TonB-dependent receptor [Pseudohongiella sp.]|uniref:TonB-dependent receptor plug domain-containing protein n=1 Tax=marine sediment metagenome TaxID=412755 RepID=A0A0F9Z323_9ZZZZ|nr:TonB-dependent receptor [Pseudohongiella sp.]HDZ09230.1 TonB-dependent receptor [Pseudohongiella sp.]HEA63342.1 TonB-dependent receptor [Pseudohongiella sp.]